MNTREISKEETYMISYLRELQEAKYIKDIIYQPEPFILSHKLELPIKKKLKTKSKLIYKTLLQEHVYTTDFLVKWTGENKFHQDFSDSYIEEEFPIFFSHNNVSYIEVKSNYDMNSGTRLFTSRTQPWIYEKYDIYINLIKVPEVFARTFVPKEILSDFYYKVNTKKANKGAKKWDWHYKTLEEYLNE